MTSPEDSSNNTNKTLLYVLIGLVSLLVILALVLMTLWLTNRGGSADGGEEPGIVVPPLVGTATTDAVAPTSPVSSPTPLPDQPVVIPTPEPQNPTGRVTAANGVNLRTGPGEVYPIIGIAPFGAEGVITGRSADGQWWVVFVPTAPNSQAWVSAQFVAATNAENVPVIAAPPTPVPAATATAVATATPLLSFTADRTTLNQGECTTLRWRVENIQAVWVYPLGQPYQDFPVTGNGSRQECPVQTTTYEMRVQQVDGSFVLQQLTITVNITNPLAGTSWRLFALNGDTAPVPDSLVTVSFAANGRYNANGGCNTLNGDYAVNGNSIVIGAPSGTMLTCSDELNQQERAFTIALQAANTFEINGMQLIIRNAGGQEVLRFSRTN